MRASRKSCPHWVLHHIVNPSPHILDFTHSAIEGFLLPQRSPSAKQLIDSMCGNTLDLLQDFGKANLAVSS